MIPLFQSGLNDYYVLRNFFSFYVFFLTKGVQSCVDCTPFLRFQHLKTPYYFYYFFLKKCATVAHFFSTVISLFFPTASTFFGRVVYALGPQTTRPHHENFLHSFSFSPLQCFKHKKRRVPNAFFCMKIYFHYCNISLLRNWSFPHEYFNMYFFEFLLWYCYDIAMTEICPQLCPGLCPDYPGQGIVWAYFFLLETLDIHSFLCFRKSKKVLDYYLFYNYLLLLQLQCFKCKKRRCNLGEGTTSFFAFSIV